ncbi:unnamed protein product, partial [Closterium sp. Naga37s-1]
MFLTRSEYDRGVSTFSPEGRLFQVEYAIEAIKLGSTAVGIQTKEGVVLAVEKRITSPLLEPRSVEKIMEVDSHIGAAMSGLTADARTLIHHGRIQTQSHRFSYNEPMLVESCTQALCDLSLKFGEGGDDSMSRPFGVALLVAGVDKYGPCLYHTDPSGTFVRYDAKAIGAGTEGAQANLQDSYNKDMSLEEAETLALSTLKQVMEEKVSATNVDIAKVAPTYHLPRGETLADLHPALCATLPSSASTLSARHLLPSLTTFVAPQTPQQHSTSPPSAPPSPPPPPPHPPATCCPPCGPQKHPLLAHLALLQRKPFYGNTCSYRSTARGCWRKQQRAMEVEERAGGAIIARACYNSWLGATRPILNPPTDSIGVNTTPSSPAATSVEFAMSPATATSPVPATSAPSMSAASATSAVPSTPLLDICSLRHPLLLQQYRAAQKRANQMLQKAKRAANRLRMKVEEEVERAEAAVPVPIDVTVRSGYYVVTVTGPNTNTSGKHSAIKAVGSAAMTAQCGENGESMCGCFGREEGREGLLQGDIYVQASSLARFPLFSLASGRQQQRAKHPGSCHPSLARAAGRGHFTASAALLLLLGPRPVGGTLGSRTLQLSLMMTVWHGSPHVPPLSTYPFDSHGCLRAYEMSLIGMPLPQFE